MIMKTKWGNQDHSAIEEKTKLVAQWQLQILVLDPSEVANLKKADANKDFSSPNHFDISQDNIKENDHDVNENDPIDNNNSDSSKHKEKTMSNRNTKTKAPTTVILRDSILKNVYGNTISKAT